MQLHGIGVKVMQDVMRGVRKKYLILALTYTESRKIKSCGGRIFNSIME